MLIPFPVLPNLLLSILLNPFFSSFLPLKPPVFCFATILPILYSHFCPFVDFFLIFSCLRFLPSFFFSLPVDHLLSSSSSHWFLWRTSHLPEHLVHVLGETVWGGKGEAPFWRGFQWNFPVDFCWVQDKYWLHLGEMWWWWLYQYLLAMVIP